MIACRVGRAVVWAASLWTAPLALAGEAPVSVVGELPVPVVGEASISAPGEAPEEAVARIRAESLMEDVRFLAAPELRGRLAGSPGYLEAARWAAGRFAELGLKPTGDDGYLHALSIEYNDIAECRLSILHADGTERELEVGDDYACRGLTGSGDITAPVVFAGYGLSDPARGYDDYAGLDVRGKIVLAVKERPPFEPDSTGWGDAWYPRPKGLAAASHGAVALLIVSSPSEGRPQLPIGSMLEGGGEYDPDFPRLQVDASVAAALFEGSGLSLAELQARIDSTRSPASMNLAARARLRVSAEYLADQTSFSVIGRLDGADPVLREEFVVVGAHLDHVGRQGDSLYYPGANDNASGSAAVLGIAEAFANSAARPARSILFGLWSSEEAGLLGAERFVEHPAVPLERIVAYVNFDCVGHGDSIQIGGGESYPRFWEAARALDRADAGLLVEDTWPGGGADAEPFEDAGIPNLYFASRPSYTHLHRPSDTPETLNPPLLEAVARLGFRTAWRLCEDDSLAARPVGREG